MSNMMEFLESLNNKELRAKCLEYDLPNVPVTDSSRKILIKRLHAAMSGEKKEVKKAEPKRRETVHVTNVTVVDDSDDSEAAGSGLNRSYPITRQCLKKNPDQSLEFEGLGDKIRSPGSSHSSKTKLKTTSTPNSGFSDGKENTFSRDSSISSASAVSRSDRSVSLSRSGITTTSYSVEVERKTNLPELYHGEDVEEEAEEEAEEEMDVDEKDDGGESSFQTFAYDRNSYKPSYDYNTNLETRTNPISCLKKNNLSQVNIAPSNARVSFYEPEEEPKTTFQTYQEERPYRSSLSPTLKRSFQNDLAYVPRESIQPEPTLYPFQMLNNTAKSVASSMNSSSAYFSEPSPTPIIKSRLSTGSHVATKPYQRPSVNKNSNYKASYGYNEGGLTDESESNSSYSESEYNESNISTEDKPMTKTFSNNSMYTSSPKSQHVRSTLSRRSLHPQNDSVKVKFFQLLSALDKKYHITTITFWGSLIIFFIFLLILFFF